MQTRCKPGDMAMVIRCPLFPEYLGRVLTVVELYHDWQSFGNPVWHTDPMLKHGTYEVLADDHCLLPIRPGDLDDKDEDEKPNKIDLDCLVI